MHVGTPRAFRATLSPADMTDRFSLAREIRAIRGAFMHPRRRARTVRGRRSRTAAVFVRFRGSAGTGAGGRHAFGAGGRHLPAAASVAVSRDLSADTMLARGQSCANGDAPVACRRTELRVRPNDAGIGTVMRCLRPASRAPPAVPPWRSSRGQAAGPSSSPQRRGVSTSCAAGRPQTFTVAATDEGALRGALGRRPATPPSTGAGAQVSLGRRTFRRRRRRRPRPARSSSAVEATESSRGALIWRRPPTPPPGRCRRQRRTRAARRRQCQHCHENARHRSRARARRGPSERVGAGA